ncbi:hypothetical protein [Porphyromonas loveana]|uniref:hypothetical protein n=1 Tax=Porphyromonas loveana TaxID=1884669 RepID=UPI0035A1A677
MNKKTAYIRPCMTCMRINASMILAASGFVNMNSDTVPQTEPSGAKQMYIWDDNSPQ